MLMKPDFLKQTAYDFLSKNQVMSIAISSEDKPTASVVIYHVDEDLNLYFVTDENSYKAKILLKNPKISLAVWKFSQLLIQADGITELISETLYKHKIIDEIAQAAVKIKKFWPPILAISDVKYSVFKIKPSWMRLMDINLTNLQKIKNPYKEIRF